MAQKPQINEFYLGQKNAPIVFLLNLGGALGAPIFFAEYIVEDNNLIVFTNVNVLNPILEVGGVFVPALVGDCVFTQILMRIDGRQVIGNELGGFGAGLPFSLVSYNVKLRAIVGPAKPIEFYYWCIAPSLGPGDFVIGFWVLTYHTFDRKILEHYSEYDILQFVHNLGD